MQLSVYVGSADSPAESRKSKSIPVSFILHRKIQEFTNLNHVDLNPAKIQLIWKNMLCTLANINDMSPANHTEAIKSLVNIWETMERIRILQPYQGVTMPPLFEFASWIFQAADLGR